MNKVVNERFQETYYEHTLENGLKVILWEKKDYAKSFFMMASPLGALDLEQVDENGKSYSFPSGIAHFLEHKMFEKQNQDVMEEFTAMGASCNAFTSYNETAYYFSTTEDPIKPLNLLLDFVQNLDISKESVEKEKGIIIQELEMYQQMSETRILNETMSAVFENHPLKYDIGGDRESVSSTTKEQLDECYALNYHPSKMILVGVSGHDCQKLMDVIIENQSKKTFPEIPSVNRKSVVEKKEVFKKEHSLSMDITVPKVCIAYKLEGIENPKDRNRIEWCYKMLFDMYFSSLNPKYQQWLDQEIINNSFTFEIDFGADYGILLFYSESEKTNEFIDTIKNELMSINDIKDEVLEQLKRRYFGVSINALSNMKHLAITFMRTYFAKQDFYESIEMIEDITCEDLLEVIKDIDLDNFSCVVINPLNKE